MRDSLRTRVLLLVLAINLVVYGAGGVFLWRLQLRTNREQAEKLTRDLVHTIRTSTVREGSANLTYILQSPWWGYLADAVLVDRNLVRLGDTVIATGIDLNPAGVQGRAADFRREDALKAILRAIETDGPATAEGGVAVPIADPLGTGDWGGLWYRAETDPDRIAILVRMLPWFGLSTALLTAGSFFALKRLVLDPVNELAEGARHVRGGDFSYRLPDPTGRDELADLVRSFNSMTARVSTFNETLSEEVRIATEKAREAEAAAMRQRRLAAMGELAAGIAHEINNPLGGLQNAVESLKRPDLSAERRAQYLDLLARGLDRIAETVARLRRFTPRETPLSEVDLVDATRDAVELVRHRAQRLGIALEWTPPRVAELPALVGSRTEIGQAILNLLANALDALEEHGTSEADGPRIRLTIERSAGGTLLTVRDNGLGVTEAELERVCDLFYTTKGVGKGSGLGLALVHNTLEQHGGRVHVASEAGRFFEVGLWFPPAASVAQESPA